MLSLMYLVSSGMIERDIFTREQLPPEECFPVWSPARNHEERLQEAFRAQCGARERNPTQLHIRVHPSPRRAHRPRGRDRFSPHPSGNDGVRFEMDQEYTWHRRCCEACCAGTHKHRRTSRGSGIRRGQQQRIWEFQSVSLVSFSVFPSRN